MTTIKKVGRQPEGYEVLIHNAVRDLVEAATDLWRLEKQELCRLRWRSWTFPGLAPYPVPNEGTSCWLSASGGGWSPQGAARIIVDTCHGRPRKLLRALRQIQAATSWCKQRLAGLQKHRRDVEAAQGRWAAKLDDEVTMGTLQK